MKAHLRPQRLAVLLTALTALLVLGLASSGGAVDLVVPTITVEKTLQTGQPGYYEPGDPITFRYEVTGTVQLDITSISDDKCGTPTYVSGDTLAPTGILNAAETWVYTCTMNAPAWVNPGASYTNEVDVSANWFTTGNPGPYTDDDTFTLKAVALRKAVYTFWNYNVGITDPGSANVSFGVDVKESGVVMGTETVSVNDPLYMWMAPGTWQLKEQKPLPAGYRVFDGRDTWNVNLSDSWRDNSFINGADFDLAITKSTVDPYTKVGGTIVYEYTVTNTGPAAVTPLVTDDDCTPVYYSGDTSGDGKIQSTETWKLRCSKTLTQSTFNTAHNTAPYELENTATVVADEADNLSPAYVGGPIFGGDTNPANDSATLTLKPAVLRKLVVLYWDYSKYVAAPGTGSVPFPVNLVRNATTVGTENVSATTPLQVMLAPGSWSFQEGTPPSGYQVLRGTWNITTPSTNRHDNTFFNRALFDLAVEKTGPEWAYGGSAVTYAYAVTNTGPGAVTPKVSDDKCSPVAFTGGDTSGDGKIQQGETWTYSCTTTPSWDATFNGGSPWSLTNTVTVIDEEYPADNPGSPWTPVFGGDTNTANNTDTFTLWAFVLRKDVGLYNDGAYPNFGAFSGNTSFSVKMYKGSDLKTQFTISESSPKYLWLSQGTWKFTEVGIPTGYFAFYPDATITYTTGTVRPDWSHLNVTWSGCSHGYWKNHAPWPAYGPSTMIKDVFSAWAAAPRRSVPRSPSRVGAARPERSRSCSARRSRRTSTRSSTAPHSGRTPRPGRSSRRSTPRSVGTAVRCCRWPGRSITGTTASAGNEILLPPLGGPSRGPQARLPGPCADTRASAQPPYAPRVRASASASRSPSSRPRPGRGAARPQAPCARAGAVRTRRPSRRGSASAAPTASPAPRRVRS